MNIDHIIHKFLLNKESAEEREILESWKKESQENIEALKAIQDNWEQFEQLKDYNNYDTNNAWSKVTEKLEAKNEPSLLNLWLRIAAVFLLLCGTVYFLKLPTINTPENSTQILSTQLAVLNHDLQDESKIWLNYNTELDISSFDETNRQIVFNGGEAYFDVAKDIEHPFEVIIGDRTVRVLGTEFNILQTGNKYRIDLIEGSLEIIDGQRRINLNQGETLIADDVSMSKAKTNSSNISSWRTNILVFRNVNIVELTKDLSKHFHINISLHESVKNASCLINTKFTDETLEEVMEELKAVYGFEFDIKDQNYIVIKTNC